MKSLILLLSLAAVCAAGPAAALPQDGAPDVEVLKFGWTRQRIRQRPSMLPLAGPDELIRQSRREGQLAAARNSANTGAAGRIETQITNDEQARAKAGHTAPPEDGYRYAVRLRNNGPRTIKSIDWDYLFVDPTSRAEVSRHQFTSDETIKPGRTKEVGVLYLVPPVKTVSAGMLGGKAPLPFEERVVLVRVRYSDGSVWQQP
ncbi:MAG TPA: hypothetical protein VF736_17555 [Pyrinomonadaceae bacterium]|jgi:hypothetical protein